LRVATWDALADVMRRFEGGGETWLDEQVCGGALRVEWDRRRCVADFDGIPALVTVARPQVLRAVGPRVLTRDAQFDHVYRVTGDELIARALLRPAVRGLLLSMRRRIFSVHRGVLRIILSGRGGVPSLRRAALELAPLAHALRQDPARLQAGYADLLSEPDAEVRLALVDTGLRRLPDTQSKAFARTVLNRVEDWRAKVGAARHVGDVPALIRLSTSWSVPVAGQIDALATAAELGAHAAVRAVVQTWLRAPADDDILLAAVRLVGLHGYDELVELIARTALPRTRLPVSAVLGVAIAKSALRIDHPLREPILIGLLDADAEKARVHAIECLGAVGGTLAIEALRPIAARSPMSGPERPAARAALRALRRVVVASPGGLSLAGGREGALSMVVGAGALSKPD
jgi:hypothetical protein